jgi:hypothetical protein
MREVSHTNFILGSRSEANALKEEGAEKGETSEQGWSREKGSRGLKMRGEGARQRL